MIGGPSGQKTCSFEAYNLYPFCRIFKDKNMKKFKIWPGVGDGEAFQFFANEFKKNFPFDSTGPSFFCLFELKISKETTKLR